MTNRKMFFTMLWGAVFRRRSRAMMAVIASLVGAATKAMSICTSPASIARGRPPWLRMMAGVLSLPSETT